MNNTAEALLVAYFGIVFRRTVFLAIVVLAIAGCRGASKSGSASLKDPQVTVAVQSAGAETTVSQETQASVVSTISDYVQNGMLDPIRTGNDAEDLTNYFTPDALTRVMGDDAEVMLDNGFASASGKITGEFSQFSLNALADTQATISLIGVELTLKISGPTSDGDITITREGNLVLSPDGDNWKIRGYSMSVQRSGKGVDEAVKKAER